MRKASDVKRILLYFCFLAFSLAVRAQDKTNLPQHEGWYVSIASGPAFGNVTTVTNTTSYKTSGTAIGADVEVGLSLCPDLIVHGTAQFNAAIKPVIDGEKRPDNLFAERLYGAGLTKYFRKDFFLTVNAGAGKFLLLKKAKNASVSGLSTGPGFSFGLKAGKEWRVTNNWAVGLAGFWGKTLLQNRAGTTDEGTNISYTEHWNSNRFGIYLQASFFSGK